MIIDSFFVTAKTTIIIIIVTIVAMPCCFMSGDVAGFNPWVGVNLR